jgi:hypothetical protein
MDAHSGYTWQGLKHCFQDKDVISRVIYYKYIVGFRHSPTINELKSWSPSCLDSLTSDRLSLYLLNLSRHLSNHLHRGIRHESSSKEVMICGFFMIITQWLLNSGVIFLFHHWIWTELFLFDWCRLCPSDDLLLSHKPFKSQIEFFYREGELEARAFADFRLHFEMTSEVLKYKLWDSESKTHATSIKVFAIGGLTKKPKELADFVLMNANTCVTDLPKQSALTSIEIDSNIDVTYISKLYCVPD